MGNIQFQVHFQQEAQVIRQGKLTPRSNPDEWKTIVAGRSMDVKKLLKRPVVENSLYFIATWFIGDAVSHSNSTRHELDDLTKSMRQMTTVFEIFQQPSIGITCLVFRSKCSGGVKNLYVTSHILTQFEYFQKFEFGALPSILCMCIKTSYLTG
ncbi:uncharacterized protein MELLADRAFT_59548 [Melampsora larici-populina 98AG31]|uniref:Uncharacterized protein n=1 Tax=Melampsora larici-populina (strain 98AG31 / pathotype 3-4-7) TaxID=747676 RepID=F4R7W9_MELLP|nr:uncharacterized protein MELLADRAFT_59548 [Melampsora larici-populina 98AG31]EGG11392.1 hypothetical protein MELLADRAFT_59548 [Melampsora larici-populina 98AG31]